MAFLEARMADRLSFGFESIPEYDTQIVELDNGQEQRNINRSKPRRLYSAQHTSFTAAHFSDLLALFHAVKGSGHGFRFKDQTDYQATLESQGTTPGANLTPIQLIKTYANGALSNVRTITKPVSGTITVYQDDGTGTFVAKAGTTDTTTGLFTPTTNWTAARALKATFQFDVKVRFNGDRLPAVVETKTAGGVYVIRCPIELIEIF